MSNDLINRSEVISLIDKLGYVNCFDPKDYECNNRVDKIRRSIVELPTAYDLDKVVEQIKEKGKRVCCSVKCNDNCNDCEHGCLMNAILSIVKEGGISDNH